VRHDDESNTFLPFYEKYIKGGPLFLLSLCQEGREERKKLFLCIFAGARRRAACSNFFEAGTPEKGVENQGGAYLIPTPRKGRRREGPPKKFPPSPQKERSLYLGV